MHSAKIIFDISSHHQNMCLLCVFINLLCNMTTFYYIFHTMIGFSIICLCNILAQNLITKDNGAATCDFQQCGILTCVESEKPVQPLPRFKLRTPNDFRSLAYNSHTTFKLLAKVLIRLRVCEGWSEPLLVAHTTLLEISCLGSI